MVLNAGVYFNAFELGLTKNDKSSVHDKDANIFGIGLLDTLKKKMLVSCACF